MSQGSQSVGIHASTEQCVRMQHSTGACNCIHQTWPNSILYMPCTHLAVTGQVIQYWVHFHAECVALQHTWVGQEVGEGQ